MFFARGPTLEQLQSSQGIILGDTFCVLLLLLKKLITGDLNFRERTRISNSGFFFFLSSAQCSVIIEKQFWKYFLNQHGLTFYPY